MQRLVSCIDVNLNLQNRLGQLQVQAQIGDWVSAYFNCSVYFETKKIAFGCILCNSEHLLISLTVIKIISCSFQPSEIVHGR